jgi:PilZ domain
MKLKEHVRGELLLSKELLTRSEFHGNPGEEEGVAHDMLIADDAAEIAMGAICSQLGSPEHARRVSISDYFVWLQRVGKPGSAIAGLEYFSELHKNRMNLQCRFVIPDLQKWHGVRETTLGFIARWCQDYLHVQVWNLQWELAGEAPQTDSTPTLNSVQVQAVDSAQLGPPSSPPPAAGTDDERRYSPRYGCEGTAEISVPSQGRLVRGRIVNLSLGGCYIDTNAALDVETKVEIVLRVTGLAFRAAGEIRSVYGSAGIGIQFTGMSAGGRVRLKELIAELEEAWFAAGMPGGPAAE